MEQNLISFSTTVTLNDWDKNFGGWRCPSLKIPGAKVDSIFINGLKTDDAKYQVLEQHSIIRWSDANPPDQALISITLTKQLTTQELSTRWKKLALILPLLTAICTALISNYSKEKDELSPKQEIIVKDLKDDNKVIDTFNIMFPRGLRAVVSSNSLSDSVAKENPSQFLRKKGIAVGKVDEGLKKAYAGLVQKNPEEIRFIPWIIDGKPVNIGYSHAIQNAGPIATAKYKEVQLFQGKNYFTIYIHETEDGQPQGEVIEPLKSGINWDYVKTGLEQAIEELYLRKKYIQFGDLGVYQNPAGGWEYRLDYEILSRQ